MWRLGPGTFDTAGDLADTTDAGPFGQWFVGVGLASVLAAYSIRCFYSGHALFPRLRPLGLVEFTGLSATAAGVIYLLLAAFMHLHWFWTCSPRFWAYAQIGKMISAVALIGGIVLLGYSVLLEFA